MDAIFGAKNFRVSEGLNSVETRIGSFVCEWKLVRFQKDLIVWKLCIDSAWQIIIDTVSEGLNSVETTVFAMVSPLVLSIVSEELNSVETCVT